MMKRFISLISILLLSVCVFAKGTHKKNNNTQDILFDLSKFANLPFDGNGVEDSDFIPITKISENSKGGVKNFGGIDFKLSENGLVTITSKRAKSISEILLEPDVDKKNFKFIYLLHNSGSKEKSKNKNSVIGVIDVIGEDGKLLRFWIKRPSEAVDGAINEVRDNALPVYTENKKSGRGTMYLSRYPLKKKSIKQIKITPYKHAAWNIAGITLSMRDVPTTVYYEPDETQWKPIDISDLEVKKGSALDVSNDMGHKPAGKFGRLKISKNGKFVFEKSPNFEMKFKGTNWRPGGEFHKIKSKEDIDVLARATRKQGYNMVRWRISMHQKREFDAPYQMKPEILDLYDYFLYAMAREGVYTHLNLASHDLGDPNYKWNDRYEIKLKMLLGDKKTRDDWRKLVAMQLNHVNPYTGLKWKDDPAIATTEYFNEMELGINGSERNASKETLEFANKKMNKYLKEKYGDIASLNKAWKDRKEKANYKSFDEIKLFGSVNGRNNRDRVSFLIECGREFLAYCQNVIRNEENFTAPLHQFNCYRSLYMVYLSAEGGSYTAQNVYFAHPSEFNALDSRTSQESSLEPHEALGYFRGAIIKRIADRPMALTEWQHCHWNPFKHEAGATFPALAALNGFDNLTIHDHAIEKVGKGIYGHAEVAKSPVMRANEFLSYCFFYRGDVAKSPHRVDIRFDENYVNNDVGMARSANAEQMKLSFMTALALDFPSAKKVNEIKHTKVKAPDYVFQPTGYTTSIERDNFVEHGVSKGAKFDLIKAVKTLKQKGILPPENISDPSKEIYQSDTGEITLRLNERLAKVITARSEAVAIKPETKNEKLGRMLVKFSSVPATVALVDVDGKKLANSNRMVLIYSTDTIPTDAKFSTSRELLKFRGRQPILTQVGKLSVEIDLPKNGKNYELFALKLNGERVQKISTKIKNGKMFIELDTSKLEKEPATFFEISAI